MNFYAWVGLIGLVIFSSIPMMFQSHRTKKNIHNFIKITAIVALVIILVVIFNMYLLVALFIGGFLLIVLDKKTYTKKRLIIYGSITAVVVLSLYLVFKSNPNYALKHLAKNPETTSLYVSYNNDEVVSYQSDVPRPLASVVKILIAIEYAYQIDNGDIEKDDLVPLSDLEQYYIENTDGGAHPAWLEQLEENHRIENNQVTLHDVAEGMITFSSNANTDYLIDLLGERNINNRIDELELAGHDDIYPVVSALIASGYYKQNDQDSAELGNLSDEDYKELALTLSEQMKNGELDLQDEIKFSIDEERVWSDRLPNATANSYGKLLQMIANGDFPEKVTLTIRELMEWPMEMVPENKEVYEHFGSKGGSTRFVYNQAMYAETLDGDQFEIVLLTDDLSSWQSFKLQLHAGEFIVEMMMDDSFLDEVVTELSAEESH